MFEVRHADDAWELGVLCAAGFIDGTFPDHIGIPDHLKEIFNAGRSDASNLSKERIDKFANEWDVVWEGA